MVKKAKTVDTRVQSSSHVFQAALTHRELVAESLAARAIAIEGASTKATKDVFLILVDFLASSLGTSSKSVDLAELAVVAERADDIEPRQTRDAALNQLISTALRTRSIVEDALGPSGLRTYGFEGATPRTPKELFSFSQNVSNLLKEMPFQITKEGITYNSAAVKTALDDRISQLDTALTHVQREEQELADKLGQRDKLLETWGDDYQGTADTLTGLFRLIGRKDLAERVRPSVRHATAEEEAPRPEVQAPTQTTP